MTWRPRVPAPFAGSVLLRCMNSDDFGLGGGGDPFDDPVEEKETKKKDADATQKTDAIHLRVQQRNGRKSITTVAGLSPELDLKKIVKAVKKVSVCSLAHARPPLRRTRSPLADARRRVLLSSRTIATVASSTTKRRDRSSSSRETTVTTSRLSSLRMASPKRTSRSTARRKPCLRPCCPRQVGCCRRHTARLCGDPRLRCCRWREGSLLTQQAWLHGLRRSRCKIKRWLGVRHARASS